MDRVVLVLIDEIQIIDNMKHGDQWTTIINSSLRQTHSFPCKYCLENNSMLEVKLNIDNWLDPRIQEDMIIKFKESQFNIGVGTYWNELTIYLTLKAKNNYKTQVKML